MKICPVDLATCDRAGCRAGHCELAEESPALTIIERLVRERPPEVSPAERVRIDLVEMARAIAQTRGELAAIKPLVASAASTKDGLEDLAVAICSTVFVAPNTISGTPVRVSRPWSITTSLTEHS